MNKDLTVGKPSSVLWRFCLPLFGSIIFQQLYNIADSWVAGKFIGESALAAVGNSYEITLIFIAFAFGCNMGCSVVVSQLFGAKDYRQVKTAVSTAMLLTGAVCFVLMTAGLVGSRRLLALLNTPPNAMADSALYLDIYILGLPFMFFYNVATGTFAALGDSRTPFIFLALSSTANIGMDILFVTAFGMGVDGVAWATFICQGISCVLAMIVVLRRMRALSPGKDIAPLFSAVLLKKIIIIAVPSTLQQSFISVGNLVIQGVINGFGTSVMAGYSAGVKLNNLVITSFTTLANGIPITRRRTLARASGSVCGKACGQGSKWCGCCAFLSVCSISLRERRWYGSSWMIRQSRLYEPASFFCAFSRPSISLFPPSWRRTACCAERA